MQAPPDPLSQGRGTSDMSVEPALMPVWLMHMIEKEPEHDQAAWHAQNPREKIFHKSSRRRQKHVARHWRGLPFTESSQQTEPVARQYLPVAR
jgi:hypothetical protein